MGQLKKGVGQEDEEIGLVYRRRRKQENEIERKGGGGRFPAQSDGSPALGFATLSHSNIKTWAKLSSAQGHNTRTIETPNARPDASKPIELLEEMKGSYLDRARSVLEAHGVPVKIRKGGTIATEDVYGASPEYWNRNGDWKKLPVSDIINDPVVQAALTLARRKHGKALISCSLYIDEESPHIHVVALPLVKRLHAKRGRKPKNCAIAPDGTAIDPRIPVEKWSLDVSSQRGLSSQLERNHDDWAEVCKEFGLVRGERGSEMTEEERRARRNRNTGRASMAEKVAREEREALRQDAIEEAERIMSEAAAQRDQMEAEASKQFDERIALAASAANAIKEISDQLHAAAVEKDKVAQTSLDEAEAANKAAQAEKAEAEQIKVRLADREQELLRQLEDAEKKKEKATAGLAKAAKMESEVAASRAELARQLGDIVIALKPNGSAKPIVHEGELQIEGPDRGQVIAAYRALPKELRAAIRAVLVQIANSNDDRASLKQAKEQLERGRTLLESEKTEVARVAKLAKAFQSSWENIAEDERSPIVQATIRAAKGLTSEDIPPGYSFPGRGGPAR